MDTGRVKWFSEERGYGFIVPDSGGADLFVHYSAIDAANEQKTLSDAQRVTFDVVPPLHQGKRSGRAINVRPLKE